MNDLITKVINIENKDGQLLVSSREIAENFEKEHRGVLRDIDNIISSLRTAQNRAMPYIENKYINANNREFREFLINRDGFILLVMGFTGDKAFEWKLKYMDAFNEMEKQLHLGSYMIANPIERAKAWIVEQQERETLKLETTRQQQIIGELKPKADYTDRILKSQDLLTVTQIAQDYGYSAQAFNILLKELGIQYKQSDQWFLRNEYQGKGYTHSQTTPYIKIDGREGISLLTKWTTKGRLFLYNLLKEYEILPEIEK